MRPGEGMSNKSSDLYFQDRKPYHIKSTTISILPIVSVGNT